MGRISDEDIERVREASDFVQIASPDVVLKRAGRKYKACCPFHEEKTPSFQIDPDLKLWHCFGCGEGGDIFDYVARIHNLDFPDSVRWLAERANIELTEVEGSKPQPKGRKERLKAVCAATEKFYHRELMRSSETGAASARGYLSGRGFGSEVCKRWMLGYAPGHGALQRHLASTGFSDQEMVDANVALRNEQGKVRDRFFNRVMFPIHDKLDKTIAFGGRVIGKGEPKYLNSAETLIFHKSSNLFAIDKAKDAITNEACAIVVEGYTDAIALHEAGIKNVVATLGTALTQQHVKTLRSMRPKRIVYLFDGDSAGQKAADRATEFIDWGITTESGRDYVDFLVAVLPDDLDPADFVAKRGADALRTILDEATPLIQFAIDRRLAQWDLQNPGQREKALGEAVSLLAPIKKSLLAADYANYIADALHTDVSVALRALSLAKPKPRYENTQDRAEEPVEQRAVHVESASERMERELLTLLVAHPDLMDGMDVDLHALQWSSDIARSIAKALLDDDHDEKPDGRESASNDTALSSPAQIQAHILQDVPGATEYLSAGTLDPASEEDGQGTVKTLFMQLREGELEETIRSATIRLKSLKNTDDQEYINTFEQISAFQQELKQLRMTQAG